MTTQQWLQRAERAHDNGDRAAEDYFLQMAQQANTPPEAEDLAQGAERIKAVAQILAALFLLLAIMFLVSKFGL